MLHIPSRIFTECCISIWRRYATKTWKTEPDWDLCVRQNILKVEKLRFQVTKTVIDVRPNLINWWVTTKLWEAKSVSVLFPPCIAKWSQWLAGCDDVNKFQSRRYLGVARSTGEWSHQEHQSRQTLFRQRANHDLESIFLLDNFIYYAGQLTAAAYYSMTRFPSVGHRDLP